MNRHIFKAAKIAAPVLATIYSAMQIARLLANW